MVDDFIERNAMLLVELINIINTSKIPTADLKRYHWSKYGGYYLKICFKFYRKLCGDADMLMDFLTHRIWALTYL